jgi:5-methylcytosine-specific restriction protein A
MSRPTPSQRRTGPSAAWQHLYKTKAWQAIRAEQLARFPLCCMCAEDRRVTAATVCDHVERHNGDPAKFFAGPFQSICKPHHDGEKQRQERGTAKVRCDADGWPVGRG